MKSLKLFFAWKISREDRETSKVVCNRLNFVGTARQIMEEKEK